MKRFFVTSLVPKDEIVRLGISPAACNFSYNLIDSGIFDKVFSIHSPRIAVNMSKLVGDNYETIYSPIRMWGNLFRKIAPFWENILLLFKIPSHSSVWFYNIYILNALLVVLLKTFKPSVKVNAIVLDFTPGAKYNNIMLKLINKCDAIIKLADTPLFTVKKNACLPGIVPTNEHYAKVSGKCDSSFLLSGVLREEISKISMVVESFKDLKDCSLAISGFAPDEDSILKRIDGYDNIKYYGPLPREEFLELLQHCNFVLSTRDVKSPENQCNFPSKILEAFLHNRIVVSTIRYSQLEGIKYFVVPDEEKGFKESIRSIIELPPSQLLEFANQAERAGELFSLDVWKQTIENLEE